MIEPLLQQVWEAIDGGPPGDGPAGRPTPRTAVLLCSRYEGRAVWGVFDDRAAEPSLFVKVDHSSLQKARLRREHATLVALRDRADLRSRVPRPVALLECGPRLVLVQTAVRGTSLHVRLRRRLRARPEQSRFEHLQVLDFLRRLQTSAPAQSTAVAPAAVLDTVRSLQVPGEDELAPSPQLSALAREWSPVELPVMAGHGDLSPSNCLIDGDRLGVIDWEGGTYQRTALVDVVIFLYRYALVHPGPARAPRKRLGQITGFSRAFLGDGWLPRLTAASYCREVQRLGIPVSAADFVLIATLADLATGAAITHRPASRRSRAFWTAALQMYVREHARSSVRRHIGA